MRIASTSMRNVAAAASTVGPTIATRGSSCFLTPDRSTVVAAAMAAAIAIVLLPPRTPADQLHHGRALLGQLVAAEVQAQQLRRQLHRLALGRVHDRQLQRRRPRDEQAQHALGSHQHVPA